jgi:glycosyltransferase involved in cell wall biosynthesis
MSSPCRIVYVMDCYLGPQAGTEMQLRELINGLDRRRFDPSLVVLRATPYLSDGGDMPCPVQVLGVGQVRDPRSWLRLASFVAGLRRRDVRLAHILFNDASIMAPPLCKTAGLRTLVSRRDMGYWYTPTTLRLLRFSNRFVDAMATNCEAVRFNVHQREHYPLERTHVLPNGHPLRRFLAEPEPGLRERLNIAPNDPVVGMVANLRSIKRHGDLLHAFVLLRRRHSRAHLLLIGTGECERELHRLADTLGLADCVHFLGGTGDVIPTMKHCDVCVLSSASEGLSNAIVEYFGCGKPTVCTNAGGNSELVREGENGFLVNPGDVDALAERIGRLLSNRVLAGAMGQRARKLFIDRFTSDRMLAAHMALYDRLLSTN